MSATQKQQHHVVIVGMQFAGSAVLKALIKNPQVRITIVDSKDYFDLNLATPRVLVQPAIAEATLLPHATWIANLAPQFAGRVSFVHARMTRVASTAITVQLVATQALQDIAFDFLVLATGLGADYTNSLFKATRLDETSAKRVAALQSHNARLLPAKKILVVGGGAVGVEVAAEIATDYPDKTVTLVHSGSELVKLDPKSSKADTHARKFLTSHNVQLVLSDRIDRDAANQAAALASHETPQTLKTEKGAEITADLVIVALPPKAAGVSGALSESFPGAIDEQGLLKVDQYLRVASAGNNNIFAAGDVTNADDKFAHRATAAGAVVAANILATIKKPAQPSLKTYSRLASPVFAISMGRTYGFGRLPLLGYSHGWLVTSVKSKQMFVNAVPSTFKI
ncbi:pyridine nucleotide-disulfide oxidoreductase [Capsaspora owczarzaki ATCC 30864]|uniref:Pyridine nucleotide-disulfide oxidoreductase n=1 Tax=Capsaspora owczarzaki (strain ATCC 30864) TaxID=595528 RepID=A0A0D2UGQ4_CAPO3|nr:pyridine nucleotide-disulfide oxidoreductase [Capsaspora owczarzaki ATCC 30864]KJE94266.1 pyridine nucleotide-disulfide oxidoreductase [Capsaspora owczarzaki ATCC 30864]|eukprot:XP_004347686.1 pyridine nucleotide-disulfide oxidoreductase [Capsaspora owczarzaki ATCC 30864]